MTIAAYTGLPGHGKSYGVVENVIKPALKNKREVFTNIPMQSEECIKQFGMTATQFKTEDIIENPNWWSEVFNPGAVIVIDELWRLWPSGLNAKNVRDQDKAFLAEHRHLVGDNGHSTEIIFVTQDLSQIANFARSLVESTFRVTKLSKVGLNKRFRVDVYFGPVTGVSPPVSKRDREIHGSFKKSTYALYQSHTKSMTGEAGNETRIDNRFNALGGLKIKLGIIVFFGCLLVFYLGANRLSAYYGGTPSDSSDKTQQTQDSSVRQETIQKATTSKPSKPFAEFLARADSISISFNNGRYPRIEYQFQIEFDDMEAVLTSTELARLQYALTPINQCLVKIEGADWIGFAMCKPDERSQGWIEDIVTSTSQTEPM